MGSPATKIPKQRFKRLKYFKVACELIKNSRNKPIERSNPNKAKETVYRFAASDDGKFYVIISEVTRAIEAKLQQMQLKARARGTVKFKGNVKVK